MLHLIGLLITLLSVHCATNDYLITTRDSAYRFFTVQLNRVVDIINAQNTQGSATSAKTKQWTSLGLEP